MAKRKRKVQTQLTKSQKRQLSGLLAIVRRFPRKKKEAAAAPQSSLALGSQYQFLVNEVLRTKSLALSPKGTAQQIVANQNAYSIAFSNLFGFVVSNPSFKAAYDKISPSLNL